MSTKAEALRTCIAVLTAQLALEEGKPPGTYLGQILPRFDTDEAERRRLAEIAESEKPHAWRDWGTGVLPDQAGNNEREPPIYEGAKVFWRQMEQQIPFVYDDHGLRFNSLTCARRGGWPDFERNVRRLWAGPEGDAWRAAPENADRVARIKV